MKRKLTKNQKTIKELKLHIEYLERSHDDFIREYKIETQKKLTEARNSAQEQINFWHDKYRHLCIAINQNKSLKKHFGEMDWRIN